MAEGTAPGPGSFIAAAAAQTAKDAKTWVQGRQPRPDADPDGRVLNLKQRQVLSSGVQTVVMVSVVVLGGWILAIAKMFLAVKNIDLDTVATVTATCLGWLGLACGLTVLWLVIAAWCAAAVYAKRTISR